MSRVLLLFDFIAKGIYGLPFEEVLPSPFGVVKNIAVDEHYETLHFDIANLLGKDREAFAL